MGKKYINNNYGRIKKKRGSHLKKKKKQILDKIDKHDASTVCSHMNISTLNSEPLLSCIEHKSENELNIQMDISATNDVNKHDTPTVCCHIDTLTSEQLLPCIERESTKELNISMDIISTTNDSSKHDTSTVCCNMDISTSNCEPLLPCIEHESANESDISVDINSTSDSDMTNSATPFTIEGRRVVKMQYFIDQLIEISKHSSRFGCQLNFIQIVKENSNGLKSTFSLRCRMCNSNFKLHTDNAEVCLNDVNHSAVSAVILMGCGETNLKELTASMDLPTVNQKIYTKCHEHLYDWWKETAENTMKDAGLQESQKAKKLSANGKPMIPVTADACWAKRSYRTNYSSLAGVGAIIGINSGKVLHVGIKNKYCVTCARASNKNTDPPEHECNINHQGSSTSMEQMAIVEGFKESLPKHGLIYSQLIADNDASTYKKIVESRPYPGISIEKIDCSNHLLRNYNGKIMSLPKDTSIPLPQRKLLNASRIDRLRTAVTQAVRHRREQNLPFAAKIKELRKDIENGPRHVFGDHSNCEDYYCTAEKKVERNYVPHIPALLVKIMDHVKLLSQSSRSLLHKMNNNRAEQFNSLVAKYVGGKRINYALKKSYALRCYAAVVAFNTGMPIYTLHKTITGKSPSTISKKVEQLKRSNNSRKKIWRAKRKLPSQGADYGESCQKPDLTPEEYEIRKVEYLNQLEEQLKDKDAIERQTIEQSESILWVELRRCLLTASNFAKVCKRRNNISPAPLIKSMLYGYSIDHLPAIKHGKQHEGEALRQLEIQENVTVQKCGLHIDPKYNFLGATPDGLYDEGIIEIKCPKSAFGMDPKEAIKQKKIKVFKLVNNVIVLNKNHDWFYQIQGQLHVTNKQICLFAVWTGPEHRLFTKYIQKDDNFWASKMETRLINFYEKCLLPEIVDPRKPRSMPLRDDPF